MFDTKSCEDDRSTRIERIEKKILELRGKLGETLEHSMVGILQDMVNRQQDQSDNLSGGEVRLAKETLRKIMDEQNKTLTQRR